MQEGTDSKALNLQIVMVNFGRRIAFSCEGSIASVRMCVNRMCSMEGCHKGRQQKAACVTKPNTKKP